LFQLAANLLKVVVAGTIFKFWLDSPVNFIYKTEGDYTKS